MKQLSIIVAILFMGMFVFSCDNNSNDNNSNPSSGGNVNPPVTHQDTSIFIGKWAQSPNTVTAVCRDKWIVSDGPGGLSHIATPDTMVFLNDSIIADTNMFGDVCHYYYKNDSISMYYPSWELDRWIFSDTVTMFFSIHTDSLYIGNFDVCTAYRKLR